jgi:hypothetical protein
MIISLLGMKFQDLNYRHRILVDGCGETILLNRVKDIDMQFSNIMMQDYTLIVLKAMK